MTDVRPAHQPAPAARCVVTDSGGGLGNRLRALLSGMYLAERFDLELRVGWKPTPSCEAEFHDLFENDFDVHARTAGVGRKAFYESMLEGPIRYYGRSITRDRELAAVGSIPTKESNIGRDGHIVYDSPILLPFIDIPTRARLLRRLKVKKEILASANAFCLRNGIDKRTYGVHMRRTDHAVKDDAFYIAKIEAILSEDPSARFFLCSDSAKTEEEIARRYPGRLITRPKAHYARKGVDDAEWVKTDASGARSYNVQRDRESVIEALVDLLVLRRTRFTVKYSGSFAEVASWWGGSAEVEAEPLMDEALFPFRLGGGHGRGHGGRLILESFGFRWRHTLNETAATLFRIADGTRSIEQLVESLEETYPSLPDGRLAEDVKQGLADLARHSLIGFSRSSAESAPLIRARFRDFGRGFDPKNNYLAGMMARGAYVFVDEGNDTDVLFQKVCASGPSVDPSAAAGVKVSVSDGRAVPDFRTCDLAISPHPVAEEFARRHIKIPYAEYSAPAVRPSEECARQRFRSASKRLNDFLFPVDASGLLPAVGAGASLRLGSEPRVAPTKPRLDTADPFHICLCSDWNQKEGLLALINSIVSNTEKPERLFFHILVDRDPAYFREIIESNFRDGFRHEIQAFPTDERHRERMTFLERYMRVERGAPESKRVDNFMNFARIYLPEIFTGIDVGLYLDVDMIVQTDLASLSATDVSSAVVATPHNRRLREMAYHGDLKVDGAKLGFNAGFLLINFDLWRERAVTRTIEKIMVAHKQRMLFKGGTQSLLNLALLDHGLDIDRSWNVRGLGNKADLDPEQLERARILHWTGTNKPWLEDGWYKHLWERYQIPT